MISSIYPQPSNNKKKSQKKEIRFPEDVQVIIRADRTHIGNLFLSNIQAAQNPQILQNLQITAVVSAAKGHHLKHPKDIVRYSKYVPLDDDQRCQIYDFIDQTVSFISEQLKKTNVLVHCIAGVSRSAALVIAYLMRQRKLTLEDAYNQAKSRRRTICLSQNILEQLQRYEQDLINKRNTHTPSNNKNSLRIDSISNKSGSAISHLKTKTYKDDLRSKNNDSKLLTQLQDIKSHRSHRSHRSHHSTHNNNNDDINIQIFKPKTQKNPQQSFTLNKSFTNSQQSSTNNKLKSQFQPDYIIQTPQKRLSQSRKHFSKKMNNVDHQNHKINEQFNKISDRFDSQSKMHKNNLEHELGQIYKAKAHLYQEYSQRKSKVSSRRSVHQSTMEDRDVKNYILSNMVATDPI